MELKSDSSESAIWRLTAGKGERGLEGAGRLRKTGSVGSGDYRGAEKAGEPTSERKTAAGRIDFVLQVRAFYAPLCDSDLVLSAPAQVCANASAYIL